MGGMHVTVMGASDGGAIIVRNLTVTGYLVTIRLRLIAGGPYSGNLGSAISVQGSASDTENDSLSYQWTASSPNSGCTFANPNALATTVTCKNRGTFTLKLTVSDGLQQAFDNASVAVTDEYLVLNIAGCTHADDPRYQYIETKFVSAFGI